MLVLSRKQTETIKIGDSITITVVKSNGPVRLGVEAPPDVRVVRSELDNRGGGSSTNAPASPDVKGFASPEQARQAMDEADQHFLDDTTPA